MKRNDVNFRSAKLPQTSLKSLRRVPIRLFTPYTLMVSPVYVYLEKNERFVAIKAPLAFFTPQELEKYKTYENFYLPDFIDSVVPFQQAGDSIRKLLTLREKHVLRSNDGKKDVLVPVASFELDNAVLMKLGPLWGAGDKVEPFFIAFFAHALCLPFAPETLQEAHEKSVELFELAFMRSNLAVFLALHIGYCHEGLLTSIRNRAFNDTMLGAELEENSSDAQELIRTTFLLIPERSTREITFDDLEGIQTRVSWKIRSRLSRVRRDFIDPTTPAPTVFGEKGICDE